MFDPNQNELNDPNNWRQVEDLVAILSDHFWGAILVVNIPSRFK